MAKLFANSGNPDKTPHSAASHLGLHCLVISCLGSPDLNGLRGVFCDTRGSGFLKIYKGCH